MKKIFTKKQYIKHLSSSATKMGNDKKLKKQALNLISKADSYNWIHQTTWLGEPIINFPQDMFAVQEIIYKTKPDYIIELGVAWGGQMLFYSTLLNIIGGKKIIGVDIFIPNDLKQRLLSHKNLSKKISLIQGSSLDKKTIDKIKSIMENQKIL